MVSMTWLLRRLSSRGEASTDTCILTCTRSDVRLSLLNNNKSRPNHTTLNMPNSALEDERERERLMVEDEDTLRRANGEVVEMQKRMMNGSFPFSPSPESYFEDL